jgi:hypothetical protein
VSELVEELSDAVVCVARHGGYLARGRMARRGRNSPMGHLERGAMARRGRAL